MALFQQMSWKALQANKHIFLSARSPAGAAVLEFSWMAGKRGTRGYGKSHLCLNAPFRESDLHWQNLALWISLSPLSPFFGRSRPLHWGARCSSKRLCRARTGLVFLPPAKKSLRMSALINIVCSKCTLDAELSVGLSLMTQSDLLAFVSRGKQINTLIAAIPTPYMPMDATSQLCIRPHIITRIPWSFQHMHLTSRVRDPR